MSRRIFEVIVGLPMAPVTNNMQIRCITASTKFMYGPIKNNKGDDLRKMSKEMNKKCHDALRLEDPFERTLKILKMDMQEIGNKIRSFLGFHTFNKPDVSDRYFPTHTDVLIIGGGAIGSSIAYWLKQRAPHGMHVTVLEKEIYFEAFQYYSSGGLCHQCSLPEKVQMSLFGAEFLRNAYKSLKVDGFPPTDVRFQPYGCLMLSSEADASILQNLQMQLGGRSILLCPKKLKERFPWIDVTGVELGCLGLELEGWCDPWAVINGLKQKSINLGAEYVKAEVVGFEFKKQELILAPSKDGKYEQIDRAIIKMPNGEFKAIKFGYCIISAGAQSGEVARLARIGEGDGFLGVPLPIEPRKRYVYSFHCSAGPGIDTPFVIDTSGVYFRREGLGSSYIAGMSSVPESEMPLDSVSVDYKFFDEKVWPLLSQRVPAFKNLEVQSAWAGEYEYNTMDENGVIGPHPFYHNLLIATGFSRHGILHAPAIGRAVMELMLDGEFKTIDLSRLGFDRLCLDEPLFSK